jgi:Lon protease-like protein
MTARRVRTLLVRAVFATAATLAVALPPAGAQGLPDIPEHRGERTVLPAVVPLLPLRNTTVLPGVDVPLRIVEPRYKDLLADIMKGDRILGLVLLQPGFEGDLQGRPPVFGIGSAGIVMKVEEQANGSFEIVVRGLQKFRIVGEEPGRTYRLAKVEPLPESLSEDTLGALRLLRPELESALAFSLGIERSALRLPELTDEDLVNSLAVNLDWETVDRQLLVEKDGVVERAKLLIEYLNFGKDTK